MINFLDMTLIHQHDGRIITDLYKKPISSNRILIYLSSHPHTMKWNIAKAFVRKVITLSDRIFMTKNTRRIHEILAKNNYPAKESFSNMKSTIGKFGQRNVIYNIPCTRRMYRKQIHWTNRTQAWHKDK